MIIRIQIAVRYLVFLTEWEHTWFSYNNFFIFTIMPFIFVARVSKHPVYRPRLSETEDLGQNQGPLLIIMGLRENIIILTWYMGSIVCIVNLFSLWGFIQKCYLQFYFILFYCLQNCIYNVSVCKQSCLLCIIYIDMVHLLRD